MVKRIRENKYKRRKRRQRGGFLSRYDFAYAGRDMVNTAMKNLNAMKPKIIKHTTNQVDQIAQRCIQQIISQGGQQVEKIAPKIIKRAIEEVHKTLLRLLGKFGKKNSYLALLEKFLKNLKDNV